MRRRERRDPVPWEMIGSALALPRLRGGMNGAEVGRLLMEALGVDRRERSYPL